MHRRVKPAIVNKTVTDLGNYWNLQYSTTTLHKNIDLFSCKLLQSNPLCSMNIIKTMRDAWSCKTHLAILTPCRRSSLSLRFPLLFPSRLPCGKGSLHCGLKKKVKEQIKRRRCGSRLVGTFYGKGRAQIHHSPCTTLRHPQWSTPESTHSKSLLDELAKVAGSAEHLTAILAWMATVNYVDNKPARSCSNPPPPVAMKLYHYECSPKAMIKSIDITEKFPTGAASVWPFNVLSRRKTEKNRSAVIN